MAGRFSHISTSLSNTYNGSRKTLKGLELSISVSEFEGQIYIHLNKKKSSLTLNLQEYMTLKEKSYDIIFPDLCKARDSLIAKGGDVKDGACEEIESLGMEQCLQKLQAKIKKHKPSVPKKKPKKENSSDSEEEPEVKKKAKKKAEKKPKKTLNTQTAELAEILQKATKAEQEEGGLVSEEEE